LYRLNSQARLKSRVNNFVDSSTDNAAQFSKVLSTQAANQSARFEGVRGKVNQALTFFSTNELRIKIASAYWPISEIEFIFIRIAICLVGLLMGWIISGSIIGGLGLGVLLYFIPGIVLDRSISQRRRKFQDQLVDFFVLIKGAILVGSSLTQALEVAVKEIPAPICEEFNQVLREIRLGVSLEEALQNLLVRMQSDDLQIIVTAIILNSQMGGNLSTILEATIDTIRDRMRLFGEVRSLTAYSRYVGSLMSFLPILLAFFIYLTNPGFFDIVKTSSLTQIVLLMGLIGVVIGNIFLRRIMKIRI
jgi:tight adherence protein B